MERSLTRKMMLWIGGSTLLLLILATPLLYFLTTHYYAEDLIDVVESYGVKESDIDLDQDVLVGMFIQFFTILGAFILVLYGMMQWLPRRLWKPFHKTLSTLDRFKVDQKPLKLPEDTGTREFSELNHTLNTLMQDATRSYQLQKEFTENASHELQTPLAIVLTKTENLLQDENLTEHQANEILEMQVELHRMSTLSRSLLLLSKIDNSQFRKEQQVNVCQAVDRLLPGLESIAGEDLIDAQLRQRALTVKCNEALLNSLITNLIVNAVRYNKAGNRVRIRVADDSLAVTNASDTPELDTTHIFSRFYRVGKGSKGNGLGLAIVKSICDYHHWQVDYHWQEGLHTFRVTFAKQHG